MLSIERSVQADSHPHDLRSQWIERARACVLRRLDQPTLVEHLAHEVGTTRSNFTHRFKQITGLTPARFATQVRLNEVERRLISRDDPLRVVARETGFSDATHLCRVFRRQLGVSPGAYRDQMRR
jgi:AraC-like DNA-binding protein